MCHLALMTSHVLYTDFAEEFGSCLREQYMRSAEGFLILYARDAYMSFEHAELLFRQLRRVHHDREVAVTLVATKSDLPAAVSTSDAKSLAQEQGCAFIETSAAKNLNVSAAFETVVEEIRNIYKRNREQIQPVKPVPKKGLVAKLMGKVMFCRS